MISIFEGAEARIVILVNEKEKNRQANLEARARKPRGGRVGHARVYSQAEIEEIREKEQAYMPRHNQLEGEDADEVIGAELLEEKVCLVSAGTVLWFSALLITF